MEEDIISSYLTYTSNSETPAFFSRWCVMSAIGALLGRRYYFDHGHFQVMPNMYCMLIGSPGTRKSTAIKTVKKFITSDTVGYHSIAADKTSKEKFLVDLSGEVDDSSERVNGYGYKSKGMKSVEQLLNDNIFGEDDVSSRPDAEMFIMADEINDFIGTNNYEFLSLLGNLWDYSGIFSNRIKSGKSIRINNPTVSILGGNTSVGFSIAFPSEIFGQGFFSRLILVYGEPNGRRIAFPEKPSEDVFQGINVRLAQIRTGMGGAASLTSEARKLLAHVYDRGWKLDDARFASYANRRFTHLLKLCLIKSASRLSMTITEEDVIYANTILSYTEYFMPKALGEFGRARNSELTHKILEFITDNFPVRFKQILKAVSGDFEKPDEVGAVLRVLLETDKIVRSDDCFLPIKRILQESDLEGIDYSLLTAEEREMKK